MNQRKGWDTLSPRYRQRLTSNGITETAYTQGASITAARGHARTPERATYRKRVENARVDVRTLIPDYDTLNAFQKEQVGKAFIQGVIGKARGPVDKKTGKRKPSKAQVIAKMDFLDLLEEYNGAGAEAGFWVAFRNAYRDSFSAAA